MAAGPRPNSSAIDRVSRTTDEIFLTYETDENLGGREVIALLLLLVQMPVRCNGRYFLNMLCVALHNTSYILMAFVRT